MTRRRRCREHLFTVRGEIDKIDCGLCLIGVKLQTWPCFHPLTDPVKEPRGALLIKIG